MKNENLNIPEGEKFVKISDLINHRLNMLNDSNYMDSDSPIKYNNTEDNWIIYIYSFLLPCLFVHGVINTYTYTYMYR